MDATNSLPGSEILTYRKDKESLTLHNDSITEKIKLLRDDI